MELKKVDTDAFKLSRTLTLETEAAIYATWDRLLTCYTAAKVTFHSDRHAAILGLARVMCGYLRLDPSSAYVNGIWRDRFIEGLLWRSNTGFPTQNRRHTSGGCSWSWMSQEGGIYSQYMDVKRSETHQVPEVQRQTVAEVLEAQGLCTLLSGSTVPGGFARVRGPMCSVTFTGSGPHDVDGYQRCKYSLDFGGSTLHHPDSFILLLDDGSTLTPEACRSALYLLLARVSTNMELLDAADAELASKPMFGSGKYECLLLEVDPDLKGAFRRLGLVDFEFPSSERFLDPTAARERKERVCRIVDAQLQSDDIAEELVESVDADHNYTIVLV